jgi:hypothetical protein
LKKIFLLVCFVYLTEKTFALVETANSNDTVTVIVTQPLNPQCVKELEFMKSLLEKDKIIIRVEPCALSHVEGFNYDSSIGKIHYLKY